MYQDIPRGASFWSFLMRIDQDLAQDARQKACPCGGRLHCANYPRKPRGCPDELPEEYRYRLSFCCNRDGCRKRRIPPSVRFLSRKVYLSAIVVLLTAMQHGATPRRVAELRRLVGANRTTLARWQVFWREHFPRTPFWNISRGRIVPGVDMVALPLSLVNAFLRSDDPGQDLMRLLRFLAPITTTGSLAIELAR